MLLREKKIQGDLIEKVMGWHRDRFREQTGNPIDRDDRTCRRPRPLSAVSSALGKIWRTRKKWRNGNFIIYHRESVNILTSPDA
jgi:hypothetical protein